MSNDEAQPNEPQPTKLQPAPRKGLWNWVLGGIIIAWVILLIFLAPSRSLRKPDLGKSSAASKHVDYNWTLVDLEGKPVPFANFKGKAVFLNIWATWCGPCIAEMPSIDALAANDRLKDVVFLGVSVDEEPADIDRFVASQKPKFTVLRPAGPVPDQFVTEGIPATYILSPGGEIEMTQVGSSDWNTPEVISLLERLSREAAPSP